MIDLATGHERAVIVGLFAIDEGCMDFSPDGRTLATSSPGAIRLWHVATGQELFAIDQSPGTLADPNYHRLAVRFRPDGRGLVTAGHRLGVGRVMVWEAAAPQ